MRSLLGPTSDPRGRGLAGKHRDRCWGDRDSSLGAPGVWGGWPHPVLEEQGVPSAGPQLGHRPGAWVRPTCQNSQPPS